MKLKHRRIKEILTVIRGAKARSIVYGQGYAYFNIQPSQEDVTMKRIYKTNRSGRSIEAHEVFNYKENTIGYLLTYTLKPVVEIDEFGVSLFYSKALDYKNTKLDYSDKKFRVLNFDGKDFYASVRWKSNNTMEESGPVVKVGKK